MGKKIIFLIIAAFFAFLAGVAAIEQKWGAVIIWAAVCAFVIWKTFADSSKEQEETNASEVTLPMDDKLTSPCPVCNKEISKKAQSCPHCGEPFVINTRPQKIKQESSSVVKYGGGCLLVFLGLVIITAIIEQSDSKKENQNDSTVAVINKNANISKHIARREAINLCEDYAKSRVAHPSTVKFSRVMDLTVKEYPNGRTIVISSFTTKNSFNLEIKYNIHCLLDSTGLLEGNIYE